MKQDGRWRGAGECCAITERPFLCLMPSNFIIILNFRHSIFVVRSYSTPKRKSSNKFTFFL